LIIELIRAHTPEDIDREEKCEVCGEIFRTEVVMASTKTEEWSHMDLTCPSCLEVLGEHKPEKFPTIEEYRAAVRRWGGPIWTSVDEGEAVERTGAYLAILEANTISRS
jgi:hypothetical protein